MENSIKEFIDNHNNKIPHFGIKAKIPADIYYDLAKRCKKDGTDKILIDGKPIGLFDFIKKPNIFNIQSLLN